MLLVHSVSLNLLQQFFIEKESKRNRNRNRISVNHFWWSIVHTVYNIGSQPGVREKSQGLHQIVISLRNNPMIFNETTY